MKILMVNNLYYPNIKGGAEKTAQLLAEELHRNNVSTVICTTAHNSIINMVNGVKVYYIGIKNLFSISETHKPALTTEIIMAPCRYLQSHYG